MEKTIKPQDSNYTLASWLDKWLETYKRFSVKEATYKNYEYSVFLIKKTPESNFLIKDITELDLQTVINHVFEMKPTKNEERQVYSKSTMKTVRLSLRQSFRIALKLHFISEYPCETLKLPDAPTKLIIPLTSDEQVLVEQSCQNDRLGYLFIFLLRTGLRRTELMNLKWSDYDKTSQEIHITKSKTKAGVRNVDLLYEAIEIIERQPHINEHIFNSSRGTPLTNTVMKRLYERLRVKTGIDHLTNHVCRHTFVTRLCEQGVSPKAIAQIIGHAKPDYVLDIYALIEKKQLKREIHKLDNDYYGLNISQCQITLPPALYSYVANLASTNGIAIDKFVTQKMQASIKMESLPKVISIFDIIKKRN